MAFRVDVPDSDHFEDEVLEQEKSLEFGEAGAYMVCSQKAIEHAISSPETATFATRFRFKVAH